MRDSPYVFLSLLPEPASSRAVELLDAALEPAAAARVVAAPVRGLAFFAARGELASELDAWWDRHVPPRGRPVVLVMDEPGLEDHLAGLDSEVVVGVAGERERRRYERFDQAQAVVTADPAALAEHAISTFACFRRPAPPAPDVPDVPPEQPTVLFMPRIQASPAARVPPAPPVRPAAGPPVGRSPDAPLPDPFSELAAVGPLGADEVAEDRRVHELSRASLFAGGGEPPGGEAGGRSPLGRLLPRRRAIAIPREIGDLVLGLHPPPLIVVPARKGGVGKTVTAGAVAQVVGYALGDTTGSAAIVDQNIGNPDQWGRLDVPPSAGTVRQLMAALSSGMELPPTPAWAKTPALAVYPEDRASVDAYPPGLIQRFVHHLRERHVLMVVDLPNRLPDYTTAEAAICAAYIDLADLVILPTTDDPSALLGVLEYLETPSMRGKPVIVSYIVSTDRQLRRHRVVTELLDEIRRQVVAVETVPKSEKATLAIVKGMSILDISPGLRDAYIRVTRTAVRALAAG